MTADQIVTILKKSGADAWAVEDLQKRGWQFYFIRHRLDQNRVVNTEHITVTVYKKSADGQFLGSSSGEIAPTANPEEAQKSIEELIGRASYVRNPFYELRKPAAAPSDRKEDANADPDAEEKMNPAAAAEAFIRTMTSLPETETLDVNSYEIFTDAVKKRLVTSTGIDVTQCYPSSMLEVVTNARETEKEEREECPREIELYRMYHSGTCDEEGLKKDIGRTLLYGQDRLHTEPTPMVGRIPVLFSTADAVTVYDYFVDRLSAAMIYQKTSDWKVGVPVAEGIIGDRLTIRARRFLPNSSRNFDYDGEGARIRDEVLMKDDVPVNYWGDQMNSCYLGLKDTFRVSNYEVSGGHCSEEELRQGRYLEVVEFSDFQVDSVTGNVFGEIRLGYLHDGGRVRIVSGGSVSGSMREYAREMYCSKETVQYDHAVVPAVTKLMNVTVTGAAG